MGRAACEHAAYGLADAPTPDLAFESFLARTLYGRNSQNFDESWPSACARLIVPAASLRGGTIKNREYWGGPPSNGQGAEPVSPES